MPNLCTVWSPHVRSRIKLLEKVQRNIKNGNRIEWNKIITEDGNLWSAYIERKEDKGRYEFQRDYDDSDIE